MNFTMATGPKFRTARALVWSTVNQVGLQGVQLVVGIVLARLLLPAEFGLVAMLTIFMSLAQSFVDSGFGAALIQRSKLELADTSTVFYFNIAVGLILAGLLAIAAPAIASFYDQPTLTSLTRVLALNLVINAFGVVQTNLLTKQLEFRGQTVVAVTGVTVGGAVAIVMALQGLGVWSLVGQSLVSNAVRTTGLWFVSDWRPARIFSLSSLRSMFAFGSRLLASGIIFNVVDNMHSLVIGKLFAANQLGLFTQARRLQGSASTGLANIISRVTFPAFSEVQRDDVRLRRGVQKALITAVFINFPIMIGLAACAKPLISIFLTDKWLPCVPYLQLLCVVGLAYPLHVVNQNLLVAKGRSDLFLRLEIIKQGLVISGIALTWPFGVSGLICGQIVVSITCFYLNSYYTGKLIGYSFWKQTRDIAPYLGASAMMGLLVYAATLFPVDGPGSLLATQVIAGALTYFVASWALKLSALTEILTLLRQWM